MLVVSRLTCPSQARTVLRSTPARTRLQAPVARLDRTATLRLDMVEKGAQPVGGEIVEGQPVDRFPGFPAHERQQEGEAVPVALPGVLRQVAFADDVLFEVAAEPRPQCPATTHVHLSSCSVRNGATPGVASPGSCSGRPGFRSGSCGRGRWRAPAAIAARRRSAGTRRPAVRRRIRAGTSAGKAPGACCPRRRPRHRGAAWRRHSGRPLLSGAFRRVCQEGRIPPLRLRVSPAPDSMVAQHMGEPLPDRNQARPVKL